MKLFGKELKFNGNKIYHAGDKPLAADIKFTDGKTFQQKLDEGSLKGAKGDTGLTGPQGPIGPKGNDGVTPTIKAGTTTTGNAGTNASVTASTSGTTTTFNFTIPKGATGATGAQGPKGDKGDTGATGPTGPKGADGLTTSVTVGSTKYTHTSGNITIPAYPTLSSLGAAASSHTHNYVPLSGGTMTGSIYMANDKYFLGTNTTGGTHSILGITTSNNVVVGTTSQNLVLRANENPRTLIVDKYYDLYHEGNLKLSTFKGQGLTAASAVGTLYYNNSGTDHVGRLSCYNNPDTKLDYASFGLYDTAASTLISYINCYPTYVYSKTPIHTGSAYIQLNGKKLSISTGAPTSPATGDVWIDI